MGKDSAPAPTPDPLIGQAAAGNVELGRDALAFSKEQFAKGEVRQDAYDQMIGKVVDSQLSSQDQANQWAQQDRNLGQEGKTKFDGLADQALQNGNAYSGWLGSVAQEFGKQAAGQYGMADQQQGRYNNTFAPVEDKVASDAMNWDSAGRQESMAAEAKADAMNAGQQAQNASTRAMTSMGVNPNSGRFAATNQANSTAVALAAAGAQNAARDNVRTQGVTLRQQAAQLGQQVLGSSNTARSLGLQATQAQQGATQAANGAATAGITQAGQLTGTGLGAAGVGYQGLGTGLTAGNSAVGNQGAGMSSFNANNAAMSNGFSSAGALTSSGAGIANSLYGNQLNAWGQQQQADASATSGIASGVGSIAGAAAMAF